MIKKKGKFKKKLENLIKQLGLEIKDPEQEVQIEKFVDKVYDKKDKKSNDILINEQ